MLPSRARARGQYRATRSSNDWSIRCARDWCSRPGGATGPSSSNPSARAAAAAPAILVRRKHLANSLTLAGAVADRDAVGHPDHAARSDARTFAKTLTLGGAVALGLMASRARTLQLRELMADDRRLDQELHRRLEIEGHDHLGELLRFQR